MSGSNGERRRPLEALAALALVGYIAAGGVVLLLIATKP